MTLDWRKPDSVTQLPDIMHEAAKSGLRVAFRSGGTRQAFGNLAESAALGIELSGCNTILDYSPDDLVIAVETGCTIDQIQEALYEHGQYLALDCPHSEQSTIGGMFATGLSNPRRLKYGSLKDAVIGIEIVNADGIETRAGGMVVKNVSGYEMSRLHYGSFGAFGLVSRLNIKVRPRPESSREIVATFEEFKLAYSCAAAILQSNIEPAAIYATREKNEDWKLHVWFDGDERLLETQTNRLAEDLGAPARSSEVTTHERPGLRLESFHKYIDLAEEGAVARLSIATSKQPAFIKILERTGFEYICADFGSGLIYTGTHPTPEWRQAIRHIVQRPVFLALPDSLKQGFDVLGGVEPPVFDIMQRLKDEFDLDRRLNPGRFLAGL